MNVKVIGTSDAGLVTAVYPQFLYTTHHRPCLPPYVTVEEFKQNG